MCTGDELTSWDFKEGDRSETTIYTATATHCGCVFGRTIQITWRPSYNAARSESCTSRIRYDTYGTARTHAQRMHDHHPTRTAITVDNTRHTVIVIAMINYTIIFSYIVIFLIRVTFFYFVLLLFIMLAVRQCAQHELHSMLIVKTFISERRNPWEQRKPISCVTIICPRYFCYFYCISAFPVAW